MNAKVGREEINRKMTGAESKHRESNNNDIRLITLPIEELITIMNTLLIRKEIQKTEAINKQRN